VASSLVRDKLTLIIINFSYNGNTHLTMIPIFHKKKKKPLFTIRFKYKSYLQTPIVRHLLPNENAHVLYVEFACAVINDG